MFGVHKSPAEQFKLIIVSLWNMGDIGHDSSFPRISSNIPYWPFQFIQPHIHVHNQINNAMLCAHLTLILYIYRSLSLSCWPVLGALCGPCVMFTVFNSNAFRSKRERERLRVRTSERSSNVLLRCSKLHSKTFVGPNCFEKWRNWIFKL